MNPIDAHVGARVRLRRMLVGMSQEKLGELLGVTFQQVQKYEKGANRIGASRLYEISRVLEVPVQFFFNDMPASSGGPAGFAEDGEAFEQTMPWSSESLKVAQNHSNIKDAGVRRSISDLVRRIAGVDEASEA